MSLPSSAPAAGPLAGIRVIELAGIGPGPFCAMLLADLGAEVIRIDRPGGSSFLGLDRTMSRSRRSLGLDLKNADAVEVLLDLVSTADVLIEGLRPGVAERLGFGPDTCQERNVGLVYGRMTGWGQDGPNRDRAGHDINYIALSGALDAIGRADAKPVVPLNLIGDFGGGALYLATGILAALIERSTSGQGQVVDAAMVDGAASLMMMFYEFKAMGLWEGERGSNLLDGGAPFYDVYETADGGFLSVGPLEPQFFREFLMVLGIDDVDPSDQYDVSTWPELRIKIASALAKATRDEWSSRFAESDGCVWPVLSMAEAPQHPHNVARGTFVAVDGATQPAPAPRFSRTELATPTAAPVVGKDTDEIITGLGIAVSRLAELRKAGAVF
ncbi:MAG: CoA transferase [bacterium]|nr:CoA transferase [bacterium]